MDRLALGNYKQQLDPDGIYRPSKKQSLTHVRVLLAGCLSRSQPLKRSTLVSGRNRNLSPS